MEHLQINKPLKCWIELKSSAALAVDKLAVHACQANVSSSCMELADNFDVGVSP